jgi:hypothetical protein
VLKEGTVLVAIPELGIERSADLRAPVHPGQVRSVRAAVVHSSKNVTWVEAR